MAQRDVQSLVIAQLETLGYKPPHSPTRPDGSENPAYQAVVSMYCEDLCMFQKDTLEAGMREFRQNWSYHRWPKIGELQPFFVAAQRVHNPPKLAPKVSALPAPPPMSREERRRMRYNLRAWSEMVSSGDVAKGTLEEAKARCRERADQLERQYPHGLPERTVSARERQRAANVQRAEGKVSDAKV